MANSISFKFLASSNPFLSLVSTKLTKSKPFLPQMKCASANQRKEARIHSEIETLIKKLRKPKTRPESVVIYETWKETKKSNFEDEKTTEEILDMSKGELLKYIFEKYYLMEEEKDEVGNRKKSNVKKPKKSVETEKGKVEKNRDGKEEESLAFVERTTETTVTKTETTEAEEDSLAYVETTDQDGGDDQE